LKPIVTPGGFLPNRLDITVTPAYGRDYQNGFDAVKDWLAGKDFMLQPDEVYCSIRDFPLDGERKVMIRYKLQGPTFWRGYTEFVFAANPESTSDEEEEPSG